ncbi:MAG: DUF937 domain-containing protein [Nostocoides sp.]
MSIYDDIVGAIPFDQLAGQLGISADQAQQAVSAVLPAILGGIGANAAEAGGADSLEAALRQHTGQLIDGGVDLSDVDTSDGEAIAGHIFGENQDAVADQLGALGVSGSGNLGGSLIRKLIPILAPIVLSYLAKQFQGRMGGSGAPSSGSDSSSGDAGGPLLPGASGGSGQGPGSLQDMLNDVLGGSAGTSSASQSSKDASSSTGAGGFDAGSIINILGGLLGGGR